jgi:putative endonuclease
MAQPKPSRQQLGQLAEQQACLYLQQQGLRLVQRNFSCRGGEIDLVMLERDMLVFVEVRYRSSAGFGGAAASVTTQKQQKIINAARYFLHNHRQFADYATRFDVIAVQANAAAPDIDWIPAAFLAY